MMDKLILSGGLHIRIAIAGPVRALEGLELRIVAERQLKREDRTVMRMSLAAVRF